MVDSLDELVAFVRRASPFYAELYRTLPSAGFALEDVPIVDQSAFWRANTMSASRVLTGPLSSGVVFKSGGTTGQPKFSVFTEAEWNTFTTAFGRGMAHASLAAGERVANLFYVGELYASFLFIMDALRRAPVDVVHFPIGGTAPWESTAKTIAEFDINVVAAVPTTLLAFADWLVSRGRTLPGVERLLFGGEALYDDQLPTLARAFPRADVRSIGYASVDAGLLGYASRDGERSEHEPFAPETIVEIIDADTGQTIREVGRVGKVVITNLTRRLMPILRYPAGDLAEWVDVGRRFRICGRSEEGARVGPVTLYLDDLRRVAVAALKAPVAGMQVVTRHHAGRDQLVLRLVAGDAGRDDHATAQITHALCQERPMFAELCAAGKIHPLMVEWVDAAALLVNSRTGKLVRLVDERR